MVIRPVSESGGRRAHSGLAAPSRGTSGWRTNGCRAAGTGGSIPRAGNAVSWAWVLFVGCMTHPIAATGSGEVAAWLTVLHTNDGMSELLAESVGDHEIGGIARVATLVARLREQDPVVADDDPAMHGTILVSAGKEYHAGPVFDASLRTGPPYYETQALDRIGYDAFAVGNHEFDFGPDVLADFIDGFKDPVPFVSANLDVTDEPRLAALAEQRRIVSRTIVDAGPMPVGVVGVTTPDLAFLSSPRNVRAESDLVGHVQGAIDTHIADGVDTIVLLTHMGDLERDRALIAQLSGVDVIVSGGAPRVLANQGDRLVGDDEDRIAGPYPLEVETGDGRAVPLVTTGGRFRYVGRLIVGLDTDGHLITINRRHSRPVPVVGGESFDAVRPDPDLMERIEQPVRDHVARLTRDVVGQTDVPLDGRHDTLRSRETNLGNLVADALRDAARRRASDYNAPEPDIALYNAGGIRIFTQQEPGDVNARDIFEILPFSNVVGVVPDVSRSRLRTLLENGVARVDERAARFVQVAGLRFTWDPTAPPMEWDDAGEVHYEGGRVRDVWLDDGTVIVRDGRVLDGPSVHVATVDFLAAGGDQYSFGDREMIGVGLTSRQALDAYIRDTLNGRIVEKDYPPGGDGRIDRVADCPRAQSWPILP